MSSYSLAPARPVLADRVFSRSLVTDAALVVGGAAFLSVMAQLYIPMFPVPITGQTFAVLFIGTTLGAVRGSIAVLLYAVVGVLGLPVFTEQSSGWSVIAGPTGGYIVGFVLAAVLTGWLARRTWDRKVVGTLVSFLAGTAVIYAVGLPWLSVALGGADLATTLTVGLVPFLIGDLVKALAAAALIPATWKLLSRTR